ncbi:ABC transporter permease [Paracoccus seriniphilus]|uniref:Putative ABC transport system permease protein n=1 Tax=Paracoccus seriniphilus TaxID=184748 RepID=A0A239PQU3_9RHOB|nr:ABC transporter permease [Paracoccus seriniphilus]WCR12897.1 ABC transporter permease [Paracoccus seriniphilus]SNT72674.1 putative ABC transport system permease protein [Paracoccus seriniphilus]
MILRLAIGSLLARALTVGMTVLAIALSVALFLGVEKMRTGARASFADTISGTDLIVGARSGAVQLLLYSVFRIGNATNNVTWESYQDIAARPEVDWIVPISLGDSHRQFRVMGTTQAFFEHYSYRGGRSLDIPTGHGLDDLYDAVIGADVAATLGYEVGDPIIVSHGLASFTAHDDQPFRVAGIIAKTGTPVDRTVIVSLEAIEAIHVDWQSGAHRPGQTTPVEVIRTMDLTPSAVTAALVGVRSRLQIFSLQRWINEYPEEPLLAVLPGVALGELWQIVGVAETALMAVSVMVVVTALLGMMAMIFSGLNERRREMAIWRAMGARPATILGLLVLEAMLMAAAGAALGIAILYLGLALVQPWIDTAFGIWLPINPPAAREVWVLATVIGAAGLASLLPAIRAYRLSLADGMMVRI